MSAIDEQQLDRLCDTAAKSGELDLMKEVLEWSIRWSDHLPREAKKELAELIYWRIES